ncbi:putative hypothetical protein [Helicobacter mustelae 12198]|uniref:Uncharacterized protein n=1 Tax=Helicobacter mustelae (strain ATCC 43772 / CCUG 25715 / CIP 103759 / LMG 18044 / NCTC 12198 / R85-136P) TaxID=679897 RepID=D3UHZ5_HELM1|nr:putative hypothetical protein [Helicobacter mustelae 12198]
MSEEDFKTCFLLALCDMRKGLWATYRFKFCNFSKTQLLEVIEVVILKGFEDFYP